MEPQNHDTARGRQWFEGRPREDSGSCDEPLKSSCPQAAAILYTGGLKARCTRAVQPGRSVSTTVQG